MTFREDQAAALICTYLDETFRHLKLLFIEQKFKGIMQRDTIYIDAVRLEPGATQKAQPVFKYFTIDSTDNDSGFIFRAVRSIQPGHDDTHLIDVVKCDL